MVIASAKSTLQLPEPAEKLLSFGVSYNATITDTIAITARV